MDNLMKEPDLVTSVANILEENSIYIQHLMTCVEIGKALTSTFNMDQILIIILKRLSELIKAKNWTLFLLDPETQQLYFEVVVGLDKGSLADVRIGLGEGIAGTVALTGEPILYRRCSKILDSAIESTISLVLLPALLYVFPSKCRGR